MLTNQIPYELIDGYRAISSTINTGISNQAVDLSASCSLIGQDPKRAMGQIYIVVVSNDSANSSADLKLVPGLTTNDVIIVKPGEVKTIYLPVERLYLTNDSGQTVTYRLEVYGTLKKDRGN